MPRGRRPDGLMGGYYRICFVITCYNRAPPNEVYWYRLTDKGDNDKEFIHTYVLGQLVVIELSVMGSCIYDL